MSIAAAPEAEARALAAAEARADAAEAAEAKLQADNEALQTKVDKLKGKLRDIKALFIQAKEKLTKMTDVMLRQQTKIRSLRQEVDELRSFRAAAAGEDAAANSALPPRPAVIERSASPSCSSSMKANSAYGADTPRPAPLSPSCRQ